MRCNLCINIEIFYFKIIDLVFNFFSFFLLFNNIFFFTATCMTLNQSSRRHSFPIQNKVQRNVEEDIITLLGPLDTVVFPLTEENLALHTKNVSQEKKKK